MLEIRFNDLVCLIVAIVCLINAQFHSNDIVPPKLRFIPWIITVASIILILMAMFKKLPEDVVFIIGGI